MLPVLALFQFLQAQPAPAVYDGRAAQVHVHAPRVAADIDVDGRLDEPVWQQAAVLAGFSQFSPRDGLPAVDSTRVLVWYSPTAIYFGVRAFEAHGRPHATLADRDHIEADDQVQILLGTFNDRRQATVFGVNPLGVQMDGTIVETNTQSSGGFLVQVAARQAVDLSQDFVFQSKGRLTDDGYEVEVRIPFKSLHYQAADVQRWSLNVVRFVQHSQYEDSWAPARLAAQSFIGQSGTLEGLTGLQRGLVLDLSPVVTQRTTGTPALAGAPEDGWHYAAERPQFGANVRWGIINNLTLNATIRPDFAEVESDATQVVFDPRSAISYPEKRPFFLEGMDVFTTPSNLVYTRDIVQPVAATKITGKVAGTSVALLSAVDDRSQSLAFDPGVRGGYAPVYDIARLQRDIGGQSKIGVTITDKEDGAWSNRMADLDGSLVFHKLYSVNFQGAASRTATGDGGAPVTAPLWNASFNRRGRNVVFRYAVSGMDPGFVAGSGFLSRPGIAHATADQNFTWYGPRGSLVENVTFNPMADHLWNYEALLHGRDALEKKYHLSLETRLRGGWTGGFAVYLESFGYDPAIFRNVYVERPAGAALDTVPFYAPVRLFNHDWAASLGTPQWSIFSFNALAITGPDENFEEWSTADIWFVQLDALVRPNPKLRITPSLLYTSYDHPQTGTVYRSDHIIRVKTEYQISRSIFLRLVGEYQGHDRLPLVDWGRSGGALLFYDPASRTYRRSGPLRAKAFRTDWLFAYQPSPGTVFFAGYGNSSAPDAFRLNQLTETRFRTADAFFMKFSYLFRM
ncbi:MAG TPA: DUF5916 domain-containing protein [Gemmatimonadaceae bacterium]|nr:DUF5916 domain-containing protein [Gemmatimonadaceae bacterium]